MAEELKFIVNSMYFIIRLVIKEKKHSTLQAEQFKARSSWLLEVMLTFRKKVMQVGVRIQFVKYSEFKLGIPHFEQVGPGMLVVAKP